MSERNHWGRPLPTLASIASDAALHEHLLTGVAEILGGKAAGPVAAGLLELAATGGAGYERDARTTLAAAGMLGGPSRDLTAEIEHLYAASAPFLAGPVLLDFGCGDGSMARRFAAAGADVTGTDTLAPADLQLGVPFVRNFPDGSTPLPSGSFDVVLAFGVLHHCADPDVALGEILRLLRPGGRALVVESVFGIRPADLGNVPASHLASFLRLSADGQFRHTMFFDHLVNRIISTYSDDPAAKVCMPFNYLTPNDWDAVFVRHHARPLVTQHLQVRVGRAPLHHTLHVVER